MGKWSLSFTPEAEQDLSEVDRKLRKRIVDKLSWLQANFNNIIPLALGGEWRGYFKLRVGDWRIIYKVEWSKFSIIVYLINRRDKVYKKR